MRRPSPRLVDVVLLAGWLFAAVMIIRPAWQHYHRYDGYGADYASRMKYGDAIGAIGHDYDASPFPELLYSMTAALVAGMLYAVLIRCPLVIRHIVPVIAGVCAAAYLHDCVWSDLWYRIWLKDPYSQTHWLEWASPYYYFLNDDEHPGLGLIFFRPFVLVIYYILPVCAAIGVVALKSYLHGERLAADGPVCRRCGYSLRGLTGDRSCPECGAARKVACRRASGDDAAATLGCDRE